MSLRIKQFEIFLVNIPLRFSIQHALHSRSANTTGFILLSAEDGNTGIGEFLCRDYVTGENMDDCIHCLQQMAPVLMKGTIDNPVEFIKSIWKQYVDQKGKHGAICGLELALFDLWGKQQGKSAAELLCPNKLQKVNPRYSAVYPFASGLKFLAIQFAYKTLMRSEFIKVKGTGKISDDLAYIDTIRKAFHYPVDLRLDLNGSLSPNHAEEYFSKMLGSKKGVRWFEQPFPKNDCATSAKFQKQFASDIVLCADESVCSMEDLNHAIKEGSFKAINIRIAKNGGLLKALDLYQTAIHSGLETQLGCYVGESSVLAYAGLHFAALAQQLRYYEGCFGNYLIKWDVIRPSLTFSRKGQVSFKKLPQAGLVPFYNIDRLKKKAFKTYRWGQ